MNTITRTFTIIVLTITITLITGCNESSQGFGISSQQRVKKVCLLESNNGKLQIANIEGLVNQIQAGTGKVMKYGHEAFVANAKIAAEEGIFITAIEENVINDAQGFVTASNNNLFNQ